MPVSQKTTVSQYIKTLQILHLAITAGVFIFTALGAGVVFSGSFIVEPKLDKTTALTLGCAGFALPLLVSRFIFNKKLAGLHTKPLQEKIKEYRTLCMVRYALLDAAAVIAIVLLFLNGYPELLFFPALVVLYMMSLYPSRKQIVDDLQPDYQEMEVW